VRQRAEVRFLPRAAVSALLIALLAPLVADAALCVKRNGKLVARSGDCKRKETPFTPPVLPPGPAGDRGPAGTSFPHFRAVDASGRQLPGTLNTTGELVRQVGDVVVGLDFTIDGFTAGIVYFGAAACAGAPLVSASPGSLYDKARVHGAVAYYATGVPTLQTIHSISSPTSAADCMGVADTYDPITGLCCADVLIDTFAASTSTFDVGGFVAPFHVEEE
jgi:hypothetical protein